MWAGIEREGVGKREFPVWGDPEERKGKVFLRNYPTVSDVLSQEFSGANLETKAGLFVITKSFGYNFNKNHAGIFVAPESCLGEERTFLVWEKYRVRFF